MDAYVYLRVEPGKMLDVLNGFASKSAARRAITVVGEWDVLAHVEGTDLATIATQVLDDVHQLPGVVRSLTAPVVPSDRIGIVGFGGPKPPPIVPDACYVHLTVEAGAAGGLAERLAGMPDIAGAAVLGGPYDLITCVAQPWEIASGVILDQIHALPGIRSSMTLVSLHYDQPEEDRDQFSAWS